MKPTINDSACIPVLSAVRDPSNTDLLDLSPAFFDSSV